MHIKGNIDTRKGYGKVQEEKIKILLSKQLIVEYLNSSNKREIRKLAMYCSCIFFFHRFLGNQTEIVRSQGKSEDLIPRYQV